MDRITKTLAGVIGNVGMEPGVTLKETTRGMATGHSIVHSHRTSKKKEQAPTARLCNIDPPIRKLIVSGQFPCRAPPTQATLCLKARRPDSRQEVITPWHSIHLYIYIYKCSFARGNHEYMNTFLHSPSSDCMPLCNPRTCSLGAPLGLAIGV